MRFPIGHVGRRLIPLFGCLVIVGIAAVTVDVLYDVIAAGPYISEKNSLRQVFSLHIAPIYNPMTRSTGIQINITT